MYGIRRFSSNALLWMAAMLMPLQAFPAAGCWCAGERQERVDPETPPGHRGQKTCCCAPTQSAGKHGEDKSCCQRADATPIPSCCGCSHICACSCQDKNSSPAVPPAPTETRCQSGVGLPQLLAPVCLSLDNSRPRSADEGPALCTSASEHCISLCRFLL